MLYVVIVFLILAVLMYILLGGADFGAGILELTTPNRMKSKIRKRTYETIGPIWEANHMWLIITIVILFVGFPAIYSLLSIHLHIPLLLMLFGIIGRGTAFVFRHYDAVEDEMQRVYNWIFAYSSFVTPFFLGLIFGAAVGGSINPDAPDFLASYIWSWLNAFSVAVGLFTVMICGFLTAVFLVGEAKNDAERRFFVTRSRLFILATVLAGGIVFLAAELQNVPLVELLITEWVTLGILFLATLAMILLWLKLPTATKSFSRLLAGAVVTAILLAFGYHYFPDMVILQGGENLTLFNSAALGKPIETLAWALLIGSIFILPSLGYLLYSFQKEKAEY
ncbi:cytochrome d ubiquinol oxidase subunit II [Algoriphagus aestuariicola]|uniref:Cytochrome d ubiquinol oxidase subunit II n=1 Tax=Algoriphagus aestuariicola TaxID=1852016 RepID=A0ABS3BM21_9BACT|nr:cytochrome d ubiquinol oxidase subunit II [Algoriphagus aestuariicola]MBN7800328.1 cytochrome d ubiquinol oxidase subunit II [Algoriphagus aestuariicola]